MEIFDSTFYKFQKSCSTYTGSWPYQNRKIRLILHFIVALMTSMLAIPQTIILIEKFGIDLDISFENLNLVMFNIVNTLKYVITFVSSNELKAILEQVADDWISIKDKNERRILMENMKKAHIIVSVFATYSLTVFVFLMIVTSAPALLDFVFPLKNGTRPSLLPYANFVFFDQYEHPYITGLIVIIGYSPTLLLYLGVEGIFVLTVGHACALFAVVWVDIKDEVAANNLTSITNASLKYKLAKAIALHNRTLNLCVKLDDLYSKLFLLTQCCIIIHISMSACYITQAVYTNKLRVVESLVITIGVMIYFTNLNYIGQRLMDSSDEVFDSAYNSHWYLMPPRIRRYYILIMCRSSKAVQLTAGKLSAFSMRQLGLVIKTAASYYTVLISTI